MKALWARSKDEVKPDEYNEFYSHISHDWTDPLEVIHMRGEGTFEYQALLFIPSRAPFDLFLQGGKRGVQLYVKRVFIMDDCEALMPRIPALRQGRRGRAGPVAQRVPRDPPAGPADPADPPAAGEEGAGDRQGHDDRGRRALRQRSGGEFGRAVKEGLLDDGDNRDAILEVSSFASTHDDKPTKLREYVARMKEGQEHIYFLTGESRSAIENSPHMEAFRAKGYEVLLLDRPGRRGLGRRGARSSTASSSSPSPRARSTSTPRRRSRRRRPSGSSSRRSSLRCCPGWRPR